MIKNLSITTKFIFLFFGILALNALAYSLIVKKIYQAQLISQSETVVSNVQSFGNWVALHGRVWVKGNSEDSYLSKVNVIDPAQPDAAVTYYSKNPALAQREFSEVVAKSDSPAKFRMTSSNVMNPQNKPDEFETKALNIIRTSSATKYFEMQYGEFRYAKAVYHKEACISCHGDPKKAPADVIERYGSEHGFGFKDGDVAGVISVRIPAHSFFSVVKDFVGPVEIGLIIFSLIIAVWFIRSSLLKPVKELTLAADEISKGYNAEIKTEHIDSDTNNEIQKLTLAIGRMKNSTFLAIKKMREAIDGKK